MVPLAIRSAVPPKIRSVTLGRTLVVSPGETGSGQYALADLQKQTVEFDQLAATT